MWLAHGHNHGHLGFIVDRMRDWDRREIFATRRSDDAASFIDEVERCGPIAWTAGKGNLPIAAFGCAPMWEGVWSMWMFATDNIGEIGLSVTKLIVRSIVPMMFEAGAHRLEARSMEGHDDAQRWLETIGARREATLQGYGRAGENFHIYTWARP